MTKKNICIKIYKNYVIYVCAILSLGIVVLIVIESIRILSIPMIIFLVAISSPFLGLVIAHFVAPVVGNWFGNIIYSPKDNLDAVPEILSPIKGMIIRGKYNQAIKELNLLLKKKPFDPEPYFILVEVYEKELNDSRCAMKLIEEYFAKKKVYIADENIEMLLLYADICAEHNLLQKAYKLLKQEVKHKGYSETKRKQIQLRLTAIVELLENKKHF